MAPKRRNMFYENKKQETTKIGTCNLPPFCDLAGIGVESSLKGLPQQGITHGGGTSALSERALLYLSPGNHCNQIQRNRPSSALSCNISVCVSCSSTPLGRKL
ncbi:hypothetical protein AAG570_003363 [Ranatra chinensis]|uniref:Uncharacterized protein n=1 Tax=Ranatra chinensis TaxID=642074 RepID=A0ABD0Y3G0_9HEMI